MKRSSKKNMYRKPAPRADFTKKRVFNKWFVIAPCALLALMVLVMAVVFFIPRDNTSFSYECWRLRSAVSDFLEDVRDEDYASAAQSVYFVSKEDGTPLESGEALRELWGKRLETLRKGVKNNYLEDYSDLTVRKENGVFTVTVLLTVQYQGQPDTFYDAPHVLTVVDVDGEWKIASITKETIQTEFEKAISGVVSSEELERGDL